MEKKFLINPKIPADGVEYWKETWKLKEYLKLMKVFY
jgi:hypothetical protein